jgi:hypothetical protein
VIGTLKRLSVTVRRNKLMNNFHQINYLEIVGKYLSNCVSYCFCNIITISAKKISSTQRGKQNIQRKNCDNAFQSLTIHPSWCTGGCRFTLELVELSLFLCFHFFHVIPGAYLLGTKGGGNDKEVRPFQKRF